jgi:hypothetical protein
LTQISFWDILSTHSTKEKTVEIKLQKVTLAKALNLKNRLVGEKSRVLGLLRQTNSRREDAKTNYDPEQLFKEYEAACEKLVLTKTAIAKANVTIYGKITRIAELKSQISEMRQIPTNDADESQMVHNRKTGDYDTIIIKHVAFLKNVDIDAKVKAFEKEIEKLHDEVTAYNYQTTVEVPE